MEPLRPYDVPLTPAGLPEEIRALLGGDRLQEPPQQGRTSRVVFALGARGTPLVLKRSAGHHLEVLRREHRALGALHPLGLPVPEPLLFLERPTSDGPEGWLVTQRLLGTTLEAARRAGFHRHAPLLADFGAVLARLHATPLPLGFGSADWLETALAAANRLNPAANMAQAQRLRNERPAPMGTALIHGDLFLDNVMTAGGRVTGLIDWAFADVGDPRFDLAVAMHDMTPFERDAFAEGYGPAARLTAKEAAYFVEIALLF